MRKYVLRMALLASALMPAAAWAADYEPPPPMRPATYDWTGIFVGGWVGSACLDGVADDGNAPNELSGCGFKGGGEIGYNRQYKDFVVGIEADYGFGGKIADNEDPAVAIDYKLKGIGTIRGKIGYAMDDTLIFLTGGFAYANGSLSGLAGPTSTPFKEDKWHTGWTIGGGIEHALTDNFRIRLDYLYTELNNKNYHVCGVCNIDVNWKGEHEVRLHGIWAFNWF